MNIQTPDWVKNTVFYQIFPDRFRRGEHTVHPRGITFKPWGTPPEEQGYQGGDLYGVSEKLDYLKDLGIQAIYLNPIFSSASNHRYHTFDYLQVDPLLGGDAALRDLLDNAHARGMYVILDGVFNHASRGFWPFHHILENGGNSPYIDWFIVNGWPLRPYHSDADNPPNYEAWWGMPALPKLNVNNPGVRDTILQVAKYWLDFGIDGWRLDVAGEIKDDSFWREFRQVVKSANPQAYIVGEIWHEASHWLQGDMFDAVMNYQFTGPAFSFFGADKLNQTWRHNELLLKPLHARGFRRKIEAMFGRYDWTVNLSQMNIVDSHDMPRGLWLVNNDEAAFCLIVLCQMTFPGAPCVYYGDEVGLSGGHDPACREAFPWHQQGTWNNRLFDFYRSAIQLRNANPVLRTGDFRFIYAEDDTVVYRRRLDGVEALIALNAGKSKRSINLLGTDLLHSTYQQIWPQIGTATLEMEGANLHLELGQQTGLVLVSG
jgi:cyclomaltodextrinase / maltogenic alpha-amylase / neopullulanase